VLEPLRRYLAGSEAEVIYNGVPDCGPPKPRSLTGRVGMIGRICPEKGQKVFVEAARIVAPYLPHSTFVVCGATQFSDPKAEAYSRAVREQAAGLPIEFTGWRDDIGDVLRSLDLLVVPSMPLAEATTRVIPEAYSAGVPVLASDLPGIREILKDGETGFLFPAGKTGALANRIREIMSAPPQSLAAVTAKARRQFEERFSIDVYRRRMIQSLERVGARALA
jgi:glycosyltransferase involved in cell wall biosynthesis